MRKGIPLLLSLLVFGAARSEAAAQASCEDSNAHLNAGADALAGFQGTGPEAFKRYRGAALLAARETGGPVPSPSCLLRRYTLVRYGESMVRDLQEMIGFRTFATEGKENWGAPEFVRQREWLEKKARALGFDFKGYDGRVEEITLPGPAPILALLTHGDVQDVAGQQWSSPPWEARLVGDKMVGRGTEDDKGPIVASLYAMAALRDSGWTRNSTVRLLIANGEESSWAEIPYYLERAPMPDHTLGIDAAYPVTHAQKGYGVITFRAAPVAEPRAGAWRVVKMSGGSGLSIIAERGEALLAPAGEAKDPTAALADLSRLAAEWAAAHPPAKLTVSREGESLKVLAEGRGGHSSVPASGHNALGDLTAFLSTLDLRMDAWGALAAFTGIALGTETDGRSLGIAHRDAAMGDLTVSLGFLQEEGGVPVAKINIRAPKGITREEIEKKLAERAAAFEGRAGAAVAAKVDSLGSSHYVAPEGELVANLLAAWEEVTGQPGRPIAIGGGTQARLFKGGVDFGPALSMEDYRGHGTDEYLTVDELHRIAELTVAALWRLVGASK